MCTRRGFCRVVVAATAAVPAGNVTVKSRSAVWHVPGGDRSVMGGDKLRDDSETDAAAAGLIAVRSAPEPFEHVWQVLFGDPWAVVDDLEAR